MKEQELVLYLSAKHSVTLHTPFCAFIFGALMWKGWGSPGVIGKMLAWFLMVVHAQGANTALPVGLKILIFL